MQSGTRTNRIRENAAIYCFTIFTISVLSLIILPLSLQADDSIDITADHIEYDSEQNSYNARGSVIINLEGASLKADKVFFDNNTSDGIARGNAVFEDSDAIISSDRIEINLKSKLGTVYDGYIFYKKKEYHIQGGTLEKVGEKTFSLDKATVTTCDGESPAWSISGKDITIKQHKSIRAWHGKFQIKKLPILYTPYFWAPLTKKRETGLLFPSFGYSSNTGYYYKQGFYVAIKDNHDITMYLDYHSKKGVAQGLDYRFKLSENTDGETWLYRIKDRQTSATYLELKSYINHSFSKDLKSYIKIHTVNEVDYYETLGSTSAKRFGLDSWKINPFGYSIDERVLKYLESNMYVSRFFRSGHAYLLGQFRQSIENDSKEIPQSIPETGLIINTRSKGPFSYNVSFKGTNIWREEGQKGQRLQIVPNLLFGFGRTLNFTQKIGLFNTFYNLDNPSDSIYRTFANLTTSATTRFFKKYNSFVHIIEPVMSYSYTPSISPDKITAFDSEESFINTSSVAYSIGNILKGSESLNLSSKFVLSQSYDFLKDDQPFSPISGEGSLSSQRINVSLNTSYDVYDDMLDTVIASLIFQGDKGYFGMGKNFRDTSSLDEYTLEGILQSPLEIGNKSVPISLFGKIWYDVNTEAIEQSSVSTSYNSQCWSFTVTYTNKPNEYNILFRIELKGLGAGQLGSLNTPVIFTDPTGRSMNLNSFGF